VRLRISESLSSESEEGEPRQRSRRQDLALIDLSQEDERDSTIPEPHHLLEEGSRSRLGLFRFQTQTIPLPNGPFEPSVYKRLCTEKSKEILSRRLEIGGLNVANRSELPLISTSFFQFDKCPICIRNRPLDYSLSCQQCSTFICRHCQFNYRKTICPTCKMPDALKPISFKEKILLKNVQIPCEKCKVQIQIKDHFAIVRHKIECTIPFWKLHSYKGDPSKLEDLVDCLASNSKEMDNINPNLIILRGRIIEETQLNWNLIIAVDSSFTSNHNLVLLNSLNNRYFMFFV